MSSRCPKCNEKLKSTYLKQNCPKCGVNMLYYKLDEQLEADAKKAAKEVAAVNHFVDILKRSAIGSPLNIIRLILFFTPLASMCLPMYWAGHKNVSLITFIMSIINHGFDFGALMADKSYFFAVLSMVLIIVLSLAVIISSLFSVTKRGFRRNIIFSAINTTVFGVLSVLVCVMDDSAYPKAGFYVTMAIYFVEIVLHYLCAKPKTKKRKLVSCVSALLCVGFVIAGLPQQPVQSVSCTAIEQGDVSVVSFNVASAFGTSFEDTDSMDRCNRFASCINDLQPDFVGTQEMNSFWLESLDKSLNGYKSYGVKRGGDSEEKNSEMNAIFFKDSYDVIDENTIWLSETPNEESKYTYIDEEGKPAEAGCNRICTYAVLTNSATKKMFIFLNTHLDNSSEQARVFGAQVILDKIAELQEDYKDATVILTGDFNEDSEGEAYKLLTKSLNDCTKEEVQKATYQEWGYRQTGDKPIDFIFTTGNNVDYGVIDNLSNGYLSDHYGIQATINVN